MHTFEIKMKISKVVFQQLLKTLPYLTFVNENKLRSNYYARKGILQIELRVHHYFNKITDCDEKVFYLLLRINASMVVGDGNLFALKLQNYSSNDFIKALQRRLYEINEFRILRLDKLDMELWKLERVDIAIDIIVQNPELTSLLCNLGIPYNYNNMQRKSIDKPIDILYKESCCFCSNSREINFYNKKAAMENNKKVIDINIAEVSNIFRLEIQLLKPGVIYNGRKTMSGRSLELYLNEKYSTAYILKELDRVFGNEKYVNLSTAIQLINDCNETDEEKRKMILTIKLIHKMGGLFNLEKAIANNAVELNCNLGNLKTFRQKRLRKIRNLNINPVTIPDDYVIKELPSLHSIVTDLTREELNGGR